MTDEPLLLVTDSLAAMVAMRGRTALLYVPVKDAIEEADALAAEAVNVPLMDRWNAMDGERKRRAMLFLRGTAIRQPR